MRISDGSSDVCSSDLMRRRIAEQAGDDVRGQDRKSRPEGVLRGRAAARRAAQLGEAVIAREQPDAEEGGHRQRADVRDEQPLEPEPARARSEEHTSELQSLTRISYAVFCLKNNTTTVPTHPHIHKP